MPYFRERAQRILDAMCEYAAMTPNSIEFDGNQDNRHKSDKETERTSACLLSSI